MNQSKESQQEGLSFVQQKRVEDSKSRPAANTHSRIFGWLDDHKDCKNTEVIKPRAVEPLPTAECGLKMDADDAKDEAIDVKASEPEVAQSSEERPPAGSNHSVPDGQQIRRPNSSGNPIGDSKLDWPPMPPSKGIRRNADRNASHF